jgi:hypothetical protein
MTGASRRSQISACKVIDRKITFVNETRQINQGKYLLILYILRKKIIKIVVVFFDHEHLHAYSL